ncbi:MAG TPA: Hsp20/alpha crystallin family protein [Baekduia sp.]|uniref:Hsp20/alpha crystallin family protein n=1 Tax=Baekduia sp. TaxID=2600305 RepID=UPI002CCC7C0A|nr:Hsp20/alpha crystallin family protein [Baekduia sp.]HMJ35872.1 Hsp20/alpha crystallin family protein [Baekduia sp.]
MPVLVRRREGPSRGQHYVQPYQVTLPEPVDSEKPEAHLHDGVLEVKVPKAERSRAREIPIQSDSTRSGGDGMGSPATGAGTPEGATTGS